MFEQLFSWNTVEWAIRLSVFGLWLYLLLSVMLSYRNGYLRMGLLGSIFLLCLWQLSAILTMTQLANIAVDTRRLLSWVALTGLALSGNHMLKQYRNNGHAR